MTSPFERPVSGVMRTDLATVRPETPLADVTRVLDERRISALPLVDGAGAIIGVISRKDLLHAGRLRAGAHPARRAALSLPEWTALAIATRPARTCAPGTRLCDAARLLERHRIHRLFVVEGDRPVGVISTLDLAAAVRDARIETPISELMTAPVVTAPATAPLAFAVTLLDQSHLTGLVVVDERQPIGVFTQSEAIAARDLPRDTPIDDLHDPSILCMPATTPAWRAAAAVAQHEVRRVIACADREAVGIVTGLDLARIVGAP